MTLTPVPVMVFKRPPKSGWSEKPPDFAREVLDEDGEAFLIPYGDGFVLYVPRAGVLALIESGLAEAVRRRYRGEFAFEDHSLEIQALEAAGAFLVMKSGSAAPAKASQRWKPTSVTFSTTQKCTLRCTYCYAEGGRLDDLDLPWDAAKAAIDLVVNNAVETGERPSINFLGEGEATAAWEVFRRCIDYFEDACAAQGVEAYVALSTNGIYPRRRTDYLAKKCHSITFSLDGLAKAHDKNRVLPNGKGSFEMVVKNMRALQDAGRSFNIRCTADPESLERLPDFVDFVGRELNCQTIHVEPVFDVTPLTRLPGSINHPQGSAFVDTFRKARRVAAMHGVELYYSSADLSIKDSFCGASDGRNFLVTSRGIVTSCNEVLQPTDPRADLFQYGKWVPETRSFEVERDRIDRLGELHTPQMSKCHTCIAKFNCAGDCYARSAGMNGSPWSPEYTYRCEITRELLKDNLIIRLLQSAAAPISPASGQLQSCSF